jgi:hypothetical protein
MILSFTHFGEGDAFIVAHIYDNCYKEICALMSIELAFPLYSQNMFKGESPDWQNDVDNIGLEVSYAKNQHIGYSEKFTRDYLGEKAENIPEKKIDQFKGGLYFYDEKLCAISDSNGLVDGKRHIYFAVSAAQRKLLLLNEQHFSSFNENELYLYLTNAIYDGDIDAFLKKYSCVEKYCKHKFSKVFLFDNRTIYSITIKDDLIKKYTFIDDELKRLKRDSAIMRNNSTWENGESFFNLYRDMHT